MDQASKESFNYDHIEGAEIGARGSYRAIGRNWANACNTPFRKFKLFGHEGGICTPCVVRWPEHVPANVWNDSIMHMIDFQPTLMAIAGLDPDDDIPEGKKPLDGENVLPVLKGKFRERAKPVFMEWVGNRAMIDGDWKISYAKEIGHWELFNLSRDRTELNDLSAVYPERLQQMAVQWKNWAEKTGIGSVKKKKNKEKQ
ncbi:hypothetical protein EGM51_05375 [Verrucomicrobia bacterium S94]|nr:hypothetical protein EGM51_05375 [Verrucomicrobia bacterium S94]